MEKGPGSENLNVPKRKNVYILNESTVSYPSDGELRNTSTNQTNSSYEGDNFNNQSLERMILLNYFDDYNRITRANRNILPSIITTSDEDSDDISIHNYRKQTYRRRRKFKQPNSYYFNQDDVTNKNDAAVQTDPLFSEDVNENLNYLFSILKLHIGDFCVVASDDLNHQPINHPYIYRVRNLDAIHDQITHSNEVSKSQENEGVFSNIDNVSNVSDESDDLGKGMLTRISRRILRDRLNKS